MANFRKKILKEISNCTSFASTIRLANAHFKCLGKGSARMVFDYSDTLVLKLSYNKKGLSQNKEESRIWQWSEPVQRKLLAAITDYDSDGKWVLQREVKPLKCNSKSAKKTMETKKRILESLQALNLHGGDNPKSFGILNSNKVVLFDYGFTYKVWKEYYSR